MLFLRHLAAAFTTVTLVLGSSVARNPLKALGVAKNPSILTQNHRVTAISTFDLAFDLNGRRIRLHLEPNHDVIAEGATITYLGPDGEIRHQEPIDRLAHKVFKGKAWSKNGSGWVEVGWARIMVRRDGVDPLFEGVYTVHHDHHHVQLASNYKSTKHVLDPELEHGDDEFMVVFRDSDITGAQEHAELKRGLESGFSCRSDTLEFNLAPEHPVYSSMLKRDDGFWTAPISSLLGKRQLDSNPSGGNSAGVNLVSTIGSTNGCPTTRKVALVGVATDCTYTAAFNSTESTRQNVINQINSASNLYENTFNISLGLANLTVSDSQCPGTPAAATPWNQACSNSVDIQQRLNLFSQWRGQQSDSNSHWTLLSTCNTGSAVGLAWLGQACVQGSQASNSSGGSAETVAGANVVVRTSTEWQVIAHETGHTFGAVHDCTSDTCADQNTVNSQQCCPLSSSTCNAGEKFIMNPSTADGITNFSPCSIGNICSAMLRNSVKSTCLTNNRGVTTISGQQCGNGIVEEGEDCDCGGETACGNNSCCDAKTCKFKNNAVCDDSNEDCCKNCQFAAANSVCRASTGVCDPAETCNGTSPYCPADQTKPDGSACGDSLKCASGQCTSRDQQCKTVMGSYTQGNDTYACDQINCQLSCASPEFGRGVCYGLQQNFLDGTPCGGGGTCNNGRCSGSSVAKEVKSWIDGHKALVIGIASAIGGLILLSILGCCYRCIKRRRTRKIYSKRAQQMGPPPPFAAGVYNGRGGPPGAGGGGRPRRSRQDMPNASYESGGPLMSERDRGPPVPPAGPPPGWRPQRSADIPPPPPMFQRNGSLRYA